MFKLGLETVNYDQPQNGAITSLGEVTAWPPLIDGSYPVLLWDGTNLRETTITVSDGKSAPAGSVFCLRNTTSRAGTYKTQSLSFNEEGNIQVEATFFPTDDDGVSLIAKEFDLRSNWKSRVKSDGNFPDLCPVSRQFTAGRFPPVDSTQSAALERHAFTAAKHSTPG